MCQQARVQNPIFGKYVRGVSERSPATQADLVRLSASPQGRSHVCYQITEAKRHGSVLLTPWRLDRKINLPLERDKTKKIAVIWPMRLRMCERISVRL